jgi:hypothetical protein
MIESVIKMSVSWRQAGSGAFADAGTSLQTEAAVIHFQSVFDGFCMMLCDYNVKMVIESIFTAGRWLIMLLKGPAPERPIKSICMLDRCKVHETRISSRRGEQKTT